MYIDDIHQIPTKWVYCKGNKKWIIIKLHLEGEPRPENHLMTAHRIFSSIMKKETSVLQKHKI